MDLASSTEILRKWQQRLRLQDWQIKLTINHDMGARVWGRCDVWKNKQNADIEIAPEGFLQADPEAPPLEELIVHELLHVVFVTHELGIEIDNDNPIHKHYERGIDKVAKALVEGFK